MPYDILFTSFDIWLPHHTENSGDRLLANLQRHDRLPPASLLVRKLPVDTQQALVEVFDRLRRFRPQWAICCGMAESRTRLTVEGRATCGDRSQQNPVNVLSLVSGLPMTDASYHAGNFVCNDFYYRMLSEIRHRNLPTQCIFVHVPLLTEENRDTIEAAFLEICRRSIEKSVDIHRRSIDAKVST
ncbi:MAG: peptidase C15 [Cyanobacteria bacterium SID2]|nr:peptidase C15 [Cyanobacteria bacterium SID2]MBP0005168.1 peptidase C15 [Cyanobacteria bacterium SBC]